MRRAREISTLESTTDEMDGVIRTAKMLSYSAVTAHTVADAPHDLANPTNPTHPAPPLRIAGRLS
jgi:hypothetical protein